jgi:membrane protein implicated in regulation of membrane protease activity
MTSTDTPSTSELVEGVLFYPIALVISSTIFPGFTLVIPGLLFVTVLILIPIVAFAIVALLIGAVVASPFLLVRGIRALRERREHRAESRRQPQVLQPV